LEQLRASSKETVNLESVPNALAVCGRLSKIIGCV
jgi:hypothetical protein